MQKRLFEKITQRTARIGVIGLGYVGLPLTIAWAKVGFQVTGIDVDFKRIDMCQKGESWISHIPSNLLAPLVGCGLIQATTDTTVLVDQDIIIICVPTPLSTAKEPDIKAILDAIEAIRSHLGRGQLIVLESTTYPGTTDEIVLPYFEQAGYTVGNDFFLAFSPERIDPGNNHYDLWNTPKIVAGITPLCLELSLMLYKTVVDRVIPVSTTRAAEFTKLLENTFRAVNIGLIDEMAIMAHLLNIDIWEVIEAAKTKPFGFMPFYPGPGVGGHCIPVDPQYLAWKLRMLHYHSRFIEAANTICEYMPSYILERVVDALNGEGKCLRNSSIIVLGVTYKRDIGDIRESPALEVIKLLCAREAHVTYTDPYLPVLKLANATMKSRPLSDEYLSQADCVIIATDHSSFDYHYITRLSPLVIDARNATAGINGKHIHRL